MKGVDLVAQTAVSENNLREDIVIKTRFNIMASLYDYESQPDHAHEARDVAEMLGLHHELMDFLFANSNIFVAENILEESENLQNVDQPLHVCDCILTLVERMDKEFNNIMQNTDPYSQKSVEHLHDAEQMCAIIKRQHSYLEEKGTIEICCICLQCILPTYYKLDYKAHQQLLRSLKGSLKSEQEQAKNEGEDSTMLVDRLHWHGHA